MRSAGCRWRAATTATADSVAHAGKPVVHAPLTDGFARTGFELKTIEAREQKMNYGKAEAETMPERSKQHDELVESEWRDD